MRLRTVIITKDIPAGEGNPALRPGDIAYHCVKPMYGCVDPQTHVGLTMDPRGGYPFFTVPLDAIAGDQ